MTTENEYLRSLGAAFKETQESILKSKAVIDAASAVVRSVPRDIDALPGRRALYTLSGDVTFTISDDGKRGNSIVMLVSQDGAFVMTHYPVVSWQPTAPTNATNFGQYSGIRSWPLPIQQVFDMDMIDISYELLDETARRGCQNIAVSAQVIASGDNLMPLPIPILFPPNTRLRFTPTYHNIFFNNAPDVDTTQGTLHVDLVGYRIATL